MTEKPTQRARGVSTPLTRIEATWDALCPLIRKPAPCPCGETHPPRVSYLAAHMQADDLMKTHTQIGCDHCGGQHVWVPTTTAQEGT